MVNLGLNGQCLLYGYEFLAGAVYVEDVFSGQNY